MNKHKKITNFNVLFDGKGNLHAHHRDFLRQDEKHEQNHVFHDTLEYAGYFSSTGGNSHIYLKSVTNNRIYHAFMCDFDYMLKLKLFNNNQISGDFTFCKRGNSQGIRFVDSLI